MLNRRDLATGDLEGTRTGDAWSRVTIVLTNRQIVFLDRLSADIRARTGSVVKRTEIIRALVDHLALADVDVASIRSESDLRRLLGASPGAVGEALAAAGPSED